MTRALSLLGAALPEGLMPPVERNNESGFWEPLSVAQLNDEILETIDSDWADVFAVRSHEYVAEVERLFLRRATELLKDEYKGSELIVLKDPRISVLTVFWERALRAARYAPNYIVMVRNPLEVAESLLARDNFPCAKSLLLWSSYMLAVERDTRAFPRVFVSYDDLMSNWRGVLHRIEEEVGFPFCCDATAGAADIDSFLEVRLRHHQLPIEDLYSNSEIPREVKTLYRIFSDACGGAEIDHPALDAMRLELDRMGLLIGPVLAHHRLSERKLADDAKYLADQLEMERELRQAEAEVASKTAAKHEEHVAELADRNAELKVERDQLSAEVEKNRSEITQLREYISALHANHRRLAADMEKSRYELAELARQTAALLAERDQLSAELDQKAREIEEFSAQMVCLESEQAKFRANAQADLKREREAYLSEQSKSRQLSEQIKFAESASQQVRRELSSIHVALREEQIHSSKLDGQIRWLRLVDEVLANTTSGWRGLIPMPWRRRRQLRALSDRGLFDSAAYLERYPDVVQAGLDPLWHYIQHGMSEDRETAKVD